MKVVKKAAELLVVMMISAIGCDSGESGDNGEDRADGGTDTDSDTSNDPVDGKSLQEKCEIVIDDAMETECEKKPSDREATIGQCIDTGKGYCGDEYAVHLDCLVVTGTYECDGEGRPVGSECDSSMNEFLDCMDAYGDICDSACDEFVNAGCDNTPTKQDCVSDCEANKHSGCGDKMDDFLKCLKETPEINCDEDGEPSAEYCAEEDKAMGQCIDDVIERCGATCIQAVAALCANGSEESYCKSHCADAYFGQCPDEFDALLECQTGKTFTCDSDGHPIVADCADEYSAWQECTEDGVWP